MQPACDSALGLVPAQWGSGCSVRVLMTLDDSWQSAGHALLIASAVVVGFALALLMVRR